MDTNGQLIHIGCKVWYNQLSWCLLRHMPTFDEQDNNSALVQACKDGNLDEVQRLLPTSNPRAHNSAAVRWAADGGHVEIVRLLAPLSDLQSCLAVQAAAINGQVEVLHCLLEYDIPETIRHNALELAATSYNADIFKLLIPGSNHQKVLQNIQHTNTVRATYGQIDTTVLEQCIQEYENELQRQRLEHAVTPATTSSVRKI